MSEVISFRLNKDNLREEKARLVLQEWTTRGYSIRQTITEALLNLNQNSIEPESTVLDELSETLSQVNHLLRQIEKGNSSDLKYLERRATEGLSASFVASVRKSAKPGAKIN